VKAPLQSRIEGQTAAEIALSLESLIGTGDLLPSGLLPPVRALADRLHVSPSTVASAYKTLRTRGLASGQGRRGTRVTPRPPVHARGAVVAENLRNLADGNPDPDLLPRLPSLPAPVPARVYGEPTNVPKLLRLGEAQFKEAGIETAHLAIVGGALDGIERALQEYLRPGDRVAVEDPGFTGVLDLVVALGLVPEPFTLDDRGPRAESLDEALSHGVAALIVTPRAQNPTGAALDPGRVRELKRVLDRHPGVLLIEDDHAGAVAGQPPLTLTAGRERWVVVRSVSKSLGPDLRLAFLAGDERTVSRIEGRQALGTGWVSHVLQDLVIHLLEDPRTAGVLERAAAAYAGRRAILMGALGDEGITAFGRSGLNCWIPVREEVRTVAALAAAGWGVRSSEGYRIKSPPAIRVTVSRLKAPEARKFARVLASILGDRRVTPLA
jgi:DNA-binding transcriptional MocR family regulator